MDEKHCSGCKRTLPVEVFNKDSKRRDGLQSVCRECQKVNHKRFTSANPTYVSKRNKRRKEESREFLQKYKREHPCEICGEDRWYVLEFHHVGVKRDTLGRLLIWGIPTIRKELTQCRVLCANCHRELHHLDQEGTGRGYRRVEEE